MSKGDRVEEILTELSSEEKVLLLEHLVGYTSANWIAKALTSNGYPVSATTIKDYRAKRSSQ